MRKAGRFDSRLFSCVPYLTYGMRRFSMRKAGSQEGVILAFFPAFLI
jgi:hypothetical protein